MSEKPAPVHKEIVGVRQGGIESDPDTGWTTFSIAVHGQQYPVKLSTKKPELVDLATAVGKQTATWGYLESDGKPNPHGGFYKNRWLNSVTPIGLDQPEAAEPSDLAETPQGPHPADDPDVSPPPAVVDWDAKERRIVRQACLKAAASLFGSHTPDVLAVAEEFERWVYRVNVRYQEPSDLIDEAVRDIEFGAAA